MKAGQRGNDESKQKCHIGKQNYVGKDRHQGKKNQKNKGKSQHQVEARTWKHIPDIQSQVEEENPTQKNKEF